MLKVFAKAWAQLPPLAHQVILGICVFLVFLLVAFIVKQFMKRLRLKNHSSVVKLITKIVYNLILLIGLISALGTAGINVTALIASLGLASFAAGYALKDMLSNLIAGFMIMFNGSIKKGDHIIINKYEGVVESVRLRETILRQGDQRHFIPNGTFTTNPLTVFDKGDK